MAKNVNNALNVFDSVTIVDVADVTPLISIDTPFRYNYNDGGSNDIDFDSVGADGLPLAPSANDEIILTESSTQRNFLMPEAEYARTSAGTL